MIPDDLLPPSDDSDEEDGIRAVVVNVNRQQAVVYDESDEDSDD